MGDVQEMVSTPNADLKDFFPFIKLISTALNTLVEIKNIQLVKLYCN